VRLPLLLLLALACVACTGGVFVDYPSFPGQSCPTCNDDMASGPDDRRRY
jgi:hypothetical protein